MLYGDSPPYSTVPPSGGVLLFEDDFSSGDFSAGWNAGANLSVVTGEGRPFAAKVVYAGSGNDGPHSLTLPNSFIGLNESELYIEFDMKWSTYVNCKSLKVKGQDTEGGNVANTTLNPSATGGLTMQFGQGDSVTNDTQQGFTSADGFDTTPPNDYTKGYDSQVTTADNAPLTEVLFNDTWQTIRARISFSDSNTAVMQYYVNGNLKTEAIGFTNRHPTNLPISRITWFGIAQPPYVGDGFVTSVKVSTGGWID